MPNNFVFADEAGCFTFKRKPGASRYFMLCTVATRDCALSNDLLALRRELILNGDTNRDKLHATSDTQATRNEVYALLARAWIEIDVTLLEKSKAQPQLRIDDKTFYQYAWYYHFKHVAHRLLFGHDKMLITAASIGQKKTKASFKNAVNNTIQQIAPRDKWEMSFVDSAVEPYLWVADYCAWAVQRKWELGDSRSYDLISSKLNSEFDLFRFGTKHYY